MAKFKYYYDLMSQPSRALYITFKMSKTPFESHPISLLKGDQFKKSYQEINKFKKVPCIVGTDDDFKLSESVAIIRYVDSLGLLSKDLYPIDKNTRARVDEYMEWQHLNTRLACVTYLRQKFIAPAISNILATKVELENSKKKLNDTMNLIENIWLADQKFLAGKTLTVADIMAACEIQSIYFVNYDPTLERPKLKKWLEDVRTESNPYFDEVHKNWEIKKIGYGTLVRILPLIVRIRSLFSSKK